MQSQWMFAAYLIPLLVIWIGFSARQKRREKTAKAILNETIASGLTEPASLHPVIDPHFCIGCGSCVSACPEGQILGLVKGKAELVEPSKCIGHGACAAACPMQAISLVFGTEKRGVDIPHVGSDFQTNVPGIYIAGELGGMGLIRNAVEQGRQAMTHIVKTKADRNSEILDVVVIGAGPAGFSASLAAKQNNLKFATLEQDSLGGTVSHFPRGKLVMTAPAELPIYGKVKFREITKEALLEFWQKVANDTGLEINYEERVEDISKTGNGFVVKTSKRTYETRSVLLSIGRRGTPRKLGVNGEDQSKVVYRLIDAEQYRNQNVLVVGGGDSALEAAASIAEEAGTQVTLSYRSDGFSRAKLKNRERVDAAQKNGNLSVMLNSNVVSVEQNHVVIAQDGITHKFHNDAVIVCAGGILPTQFLKSVGISIETKHGTA